MAEDIERSPADGRLSVMRALEGLFMEVLEDEEADKPRTDAELAEDQQFATDFALEVLDLLGLEVQVVDADGSMTCRIRIADED